MSFVQHELERLEIALREPQPDERYCQLYAAMTALAWALEPTVIASPFDAITSGRVQPLTNTAADSEDCSGVNHQAQS